MTCDSPCLSKIVQNWWSAQGYSEYYRLWNIPIHDFLLEYVYHDLSQVNSITCTLI